MIFKEKPIYYVKVAVAMMGAYFLVTFFSGTMFISNTPFINPDFPNMSRTKFENLFSQVKNYFQNLTNESEGSITTSHFIGSYNEKNISYSQIREGLQVGEDETTKNKYIKSDIDFKFKITTFKNKGKNIVLYELLNKY